MDVKDVQIPSSRGEQFSVKLVSGRSLAASEVGQRESSSPAPRTDSVTVQDSARSESASRSDSATRLSDGISASNLINDSLSELDSLLSQISDRAQQASAQPLPPEKLQTLEKEAEELSGKFKERADFTLPNGQKPLGGDTIRVEVEQQLGPALAIIFPDQYPPPLDVGPVRFSPPQAILNTITRIERTRETLEGFKNSAKQFGTALADQAKLSSVSAQNQSAASSEVDDVDRAVELAQSAKGLIGGNPYQALQASGIRASRVQDLLRE